MAASAPACHGRSSAQSVHRSKRRTCWFRTIHRSARWTGWLRPVHRSLGLDFRRRGSGVEPDSCLTSLWASGRPDLASSRSAPTALRGVPGGETFAGHGLGQEPPRRHRLAADLEAVEDRDRFSGVGNRFGLPLLAIEQRQLQRYRGGATPCRPVVTAERAWTPGVGSACRCPKPRPPRCRSKCRSTKA